MEDLGWLNLVQFDDLTPEQFGTAAPLAIANAVGSPIPLAIPQIPTPPVCDLCISNDTGTLLTCPSKALAFKFGIRHSNSE
jgi:hypothetical protein